MHSSDLSANTPSLLEAQRLTPVAATQPRTTDAAAISTDEPGKECVTIDFEGVGNNSTIPEFDGITSPGWLGIIDADNGGSGNIAFEPSPSTIAYWLYGDTWRNINFAEPVSEVKFYYASYPAVNLEAFNAAGQWVASAVGPSNYNQGPGGDPTGTYNKWDPLSVSADGNIIKTVKVSGNVNQTGIDNLIVCRRSIRINSVEFTQAIQEWQTLEDLQADLTGDGEPPVPIVSW